MQALQEIAIAYGLLTSAVAHVMVAWRKIQASRVTKWVESFNHEKTGK